MSIDLNKKDYSPQESLIQPFKDLVYAVPEELIYHMYLGPSFRVGGTMISPFREDKLPSLGVFRDTDGVLVFNDFGDSNYSGDSFSFIYKYYTEVVNIRGIAAMITKFREDFKNINKEVRIPVLNPSNKNLKSARYKKNRNFKLEIKTRYFTHIDKKYWESYGICIKTLQLFNVFPISHYFINGKGFRADKLAYAYIESKDEDVTIKIYQPHNTKMKWIANINFSIHQGYKLLPERDSLLIITKSLKDVMALHDTMKIPSVGVQGEKARMKLSVVDEYKRRFTNIVTLFDQDHEGINLANYFKEHYDIDFILIPKILKSKDYSDLIFNIGVKQSNIVITDLLKPKLDGNVKTQE